MLKKIGLAAVLGVAALVLFSWTGLGSYSSTAFSKVRGNFKKQVPLEFEIERVRHEVAQLVPDMKKNLAGVAEEMVAIEGLKDEIAVTRNNLKVQKDNILTMTRDLETGATHYTYGGRDFSANRIRQKLAADFGSYQRCEAELKSKEQLLEAKERGLEAAREQLSSMRSQKQELETQVAQLEAELKSVRLAQTRNKLQVDDSRLAQCKATLAEIRNRLKVEKTKEELDGEFANDPTIPVEKKEKTADQLSKEIKAYFDNGVAADKVAQQK